MQHRRQRCYISQIISLIILLIYFGWKINFRKNVFWKISSILLVILFSCFDLYMGKDSMIVYFIYSIVSMCLLLSAEIWEMILITVGLICFTGAIDGM